MGDFIRLNEGRSRINIKLRGISETEINAQAPPVGDEYMEKLYEKISQIGRDDVLILAGRMSDKNPSHSFATIMERLQYKETKVVVDATGDMLLGTLSLRPFLIKPNHKELSDLTGKRIDPADTGAIIESAMELKKLGAKNVLVSLADEGALLVTEEGRPKGTERNGCKYRRIGRQYGGGIYSGIYEISRL